MTEKLFTYLATWIMMSATACSKGEKNSPTDPDSQKPGMVTGKVVDEHGNPLSGVKVYAGHTQFYNTNVFGETDINGNYRLDISHVGGTYTIHGELQKTYNGVPFQFYLYPDIQSPVSSSEGAVRKITWRLSGNVPGSLNSKIGGLVDFQQNFGSEEYWSFEDVEITLTPVGTLVDGSTGAKIVAKAENFVERTGAYSHLGLDDVPVGRYKISMRYMPAGKPVVNLLLKLRDSNQYAAEITADFAQPASYTFQEIALDIKFP